MIPTDLVLTCIHFFHWTDKKSNRNKIEEIREWKTSVHLKINRNKVQKHNDTVKLCRRSNQICSRIAHTIMRHPSEAAINTNTQLSSRNPCRCNDILMESTSSATSCTFLAEKTHKSSHKNTGQIWYLSCYISSAKHRLVATMLPINFRPAYQ